MKLYRAVFIDMSEDGTERSIMGVAWYNTRANAERASGYRNQFGDLDTTR